MGAQLNFLYENICLDTTKSILKSQVWEKESESAKFQAECALSALHVLLNVSQLKYKSIAPF